MEFSSSSDDELDQFFSLHGRRRSASDVEQFKTTGASSSNGVFEIKKGCIFLEDKSVYVHVNLAKKFPERFFGDPTKPFRVRKVLPSSVQLLLASSCCTREKWALISLDRAEACEFYVYVSKKPPVTTPRRCKSFNPVTGNVNQWWERKSLLNFDFVSSPKVESWRVSDSSISSSDAVAVECPSEIFVRYNGALKCVMYLSFDRRERNETMTIDKKIRLRGLPKQSNIAVQPLFARSDSRDSSGTLLIGNRYISLLGTPGDTGHGDPSGQTTTFLPVTNEPWCCCTSGVGSWRSETCFPWLGLASGRHVYQYFVDERTGNWCHQQLFSFKKTPVMSMSFFDVTRSHQIMICGMRNGSLQVLPLNTSLYQNFDTSQRHHDGPIIGINKNSRRPYEFITTSNSGSTKVWDIRFLSSLKDPVFELKPEDPYYQHMGCRCSSFDNFLAVSDGYKIRVFNVDSRIEQCCLEVSSSGAFCLYRNALGYCVGIPRNDGVDVVRLQ